MAVGAVGKRNRWTVLNDPLEMCNIFDGVEKKKKQLETVGPEC